jgi:multidrug efflux pump
MRVWLDTDRLAALNLTPGDVHAALRRNNYLAAVGQTKGNLVQVNLLANTDLRSVDEFENLIVSDRGGAIVRLADVAKVELGSEEADFIAKYNDKQAVYLGVLPLAASTRSTSRTACAPRWIDCADAAARDRHASRYDATVFMEDALKEITKTLTETILIVGFVVFLFMGSMRTALVPLVAMPSRSIGATAVMSAAGFSLNLLTILAIVLSVGLVVDDAIVVVENIERHVREGRTRIDAAILGARELVGPIIAMTITLAAVYAPIGFQGGLTGMLFLEFAITLAAAVVVSGLVAVTLSPVMSSKFVHEHGRESALTRFVNPHVRSRPPRLRASARLRARHAFGDRARVGPRRPRCSAAVHVLPQRARAVEDQSHISMFYDVAPDATMNAVNADSLQAVAAIRSFPETKFTWSLVADWGGFGGMVTKDWRERKHSTEELFGPVFGAVGQVPGLRVFPRLDPPLPNAGQFDVELLIQTNRPVEEMVETAYAVLGAGYASASSCTSTPI